MFERKLKIILLVGLKGEAKEKKTEIYFLQMIRWREGAIYKIRHALRGRERVNKV